MLKPVFLVLKKQAGTPLFYKFKYWNMLDENAGLLLEFDERHLLQNFINLGLS
jgi:hypothetical protein